jgi:hypothetical protein
MRVYEKLIEDVLKKMLPENDNDSKPVIKGQFISQIICTERFQKIE